MNKENSILIIDSNSTSRYKLKLCLWKLGCMVYESGEKAEIITFIVLHKPKIVFISLAFIKEYSFDLLYKIKELNDCLLVVYTDEISKTDLMCCIEASVDRVLLDPCSQFERLQSIVSQYL
ncbi:MAG: hypothetical protein ACOY40_14260 [Bacillota bacterium]